jgi:hypothetical protein
MSAQPDRNNNAAKHAVPIKKYLKEIAPMFAAICP